MSGGNIRIYLTEGHIGGTAMEADAKRMVELLKNRGYDAHYGIGDGCRGIDWQPPTDDAIPDDVWQECVDLL